MLDILRVGQCYYLRFILGNLEHQQVFRIVEEASSIPANLTLFSSEGIRYLYGYEDQGTARNATA